MKKQHLEGVLRKSEYIDEMCELQKRKLFKLNIIIVFSFFDFILL